MKRSLFALAFTLLLIAPPAGATPAAPVNNTYQMLPFSQDWSDTGLITTNDDWSGVPGIVGYLGDYTTGSPTNVDPQTLLADYSSTSVDVNANRNDPNTFTWGGVTEFDGIANPVVALQGSGTADAPFLLIHVNTTGLQDITVSYNLRDIDGSADNAVQQVALHYRVGNSGNFTNVPAGYVADATTGPNLATLVTPVSVVLPADTNDRPQLQIRIMTTNASGSDEWVGVDDISITGTPIAGDLPPSVASTTPGNGAIGVALNANITINFSEPVNVADTWYGIGCEATGAHTAIVTGTPPASSYTLDPDADFQPGEKCTVTVYAAQVTDVDDTPDHMANDYTFSFQATSACATIPGIQGAGYSSACLGHRDNIEGCITGITATGFYFQDEAGDGNPLTSDGIYAYFWSTWDNPNNLKAGDRVQVTGNVTEYYDATEFAHSVADPLNVTVIGSCAFPSPVTISPNTDPNANPMALYERYEGMRVAMSFDGWVVGATKRFTSRFPYGDPEIAFVDYASSIPDDSRVFERDYPGYQGINYLNGGLNVDLPDLDFGDRVAGVNVTGVLAYQFNKYTLLVDTAPALTTEDRPDVAAAEPALNPANAEFDVCFLNVENLFDNVNDGMGDWGDWAPGYATDPNLPVGGSSAAGLPIYQAKLDQVANVLVNKTRSCMVIGLEEMEGKQAVYDALAAKMHALDSTHTWTAAFVPSGDERNITQGFLWRDDVVLQGSVAPVSGLPYTDWVTDHVLDFVRTPPTGLFRFNAGTSDQLDVHLYALHFKSKRSSGSCTAPDCTDVREKEAADLRDILAHHQSVSEHAIAGGDLNDTLGSSPINILDASPAIANLYYDLPERQRWSYVFNGESEVLDYIYLTANLLQPTSGWEHSFSAVHVNADFPSNEHASDHDPVRLRFGRAPLCLIGHYDVDDDSDVDVVDVQGVATDFGRYTYAASDPAQTRHDLDCSGQVDVVDIMAVAGAWRK